MRKVYAYGVRGESVANGNLVIQTREAEGLERVSGRGQPNRRSAGSESGRKQRYHSLLPAAAKEMLWAAVET